MSGRTQPFEGLGQDGERRRAVAEKKKAERAARARVREHERRRERLLSDAKACRSQAPWLPYWPWHPLQACAAALETATVVVYEP